MRDSSQSRRPNPENANFESFYCFALELYWQPIVKDQTIFWNLVTSRNGTVSCKFRNCCLGTQESSQQATKKALPLLRWVEVLQHNEVWLLKVSGSLEGPRQPFNSFHSGISSQSEWVQSITVKIYITTNNFVIDIKVFASLCSDSIECS